MSGILSRVNNDIIETYQGQDAQGDVGDSGILSQLAESTQIKGTTQSIIFNTDGTVQKVQHKDASNNIVREDDFTYSTNLITEVRAVGSSSITFKYHLDTLQTEVI